MTYLVIFAVELALLGCVSWIMGQIVGKALNNGDAPRWMRRLARIWSWLMVRVHGAIVRIKR